VNKPIIKLDKELVKKNLFDGAFGSHYLAVSPDGSEYKIGWVENQRHWDPWPSGWLIADIPAVDPDGSGKALDDARDLLGLLYLTEQAKKLSDEQDIGWIEAIEKLAPEDWKADRAETAIWMSDVFLDAINGIYPNDLDLATPWGWEHDGKEIEAPARFEWI